MTKKTIYSKEEQASRGIPMYQLSRESLSTGFRESCFFIKNGNKGSFWRKGLDIAYAGIINLKRLKKATTTLKISDID